MECRADEVDEVDGEGSALTRCDAIGDSEIVLSAAGDLIEMTESRIAVIMSSGDSSRLGTNEGLEANEVGGCGLGIVWGNDGALGLGQVMVDEGVQQGEVDSRTVDDHVPTHS